MSRTNICQGKSGEDIASKFLQKKGYEILDRNFRLRVGEIDIVAIEKKENILVFVEVKTRESVRFGQPIEAITKGKLRSIFKVAQYYISSHKNLPKQLRMDGISIILGENKEPLIEHFKNISGFSVF